MYGYVKSQKDKIIVPSNFKRKRRWNKKEINFGNNNNVIGHLNPD